MDTLNINTDPPSVGEVYKDYYKTKNSKALCNIQINTEPLKAEEY